MTHAFAPAAVRAQGQVFSGATATLVAALLVASLSAHGEATAASVLFVMVFAILLFALLSVTLRNGAIPAATMILTLAFAYVPSAWQALSLGFPRAPWRTSVDGTYWALIAFIAQLIITTLSALVVLQPTITSCTAWLLRPFAAPFIARGTTFAFFVLLFVTFLASLASGRWSFYAPGSAGVVAEQTSDSFRMSLLYPGMLIAGCALTGKRLESAITRGDAKIRLLWSCVAGLLAVLLFVLQARRALVVGFALICFPQLSTFATLQRRALIRTLAIAGGALVVLLYGSTIWRAALRNSAKDARAHVTAMVNTEVRAEEVAAQIRDRLSYLQLDAAAMEAGGRAGSPELIGDVFMRTVIHTIPGAIFPDKYRYPPISCEDFFAGGSIQLDLPCTPITEGVLFGGAFGLLAVGAAWAIGVMLMSSLYANGTAAGLVLASVAMTQVAGIETQAFPVVRSIREVIIVAGFMWTLAASYSLFVSYIPTRRPA